MSSEANIQIIDTHCHLINHAVLDYPWLANFESLNRDWLLKTYRQAAKAAGIERMLHVEVDVAEHCIRKETDYIASLAAEADGFIAGIIASCRPEREEFHTEIDFAQQHPLIKGFRRVLHVVPDKTSQTNLFRRNIAKLADTDLVFDIVVSSAQLPIATSLIDAAPQTNFVLNHGGVPNIAQDEWSTWADQITELSKRDNLNVKLSGLPAYAGANWQVIDLRKWIYHIIESFGPKRVVWGSDWPVVTLGGDLTKWASASREILSSLSVSEQRAIYQTNAAHIWSL